MDEKNTILASEKSNRTGCENTNADKKTINHSEKAVHNDN